jgi:hypothetical protein
VFANACNALLCQFVILNYIDTMTISPRYENSCMVHSDLPNIMLVATKVHIILRKYVVLPWMCDNKELV